MSTHSFRWWQTGVIYQIYPRSFKDTNGDGVGDLQGIIEKLDYLNDGTPNSLGVDAIWLNPFYPSPMADFGYDVADYCDVHPLFGDLATFDRLVAEAHKRSIKVIIDYVPNHTSDQHPWFVESRRSRNNPKSDWYLWRDANPDGTPPNNWGAMFGGSAWEWDEGRQQYYLHLFLKEQPDLNWRNPEVHAAMADVLRFWLKRGVDGFRMDVVGMIYKHPALPDNPPNPNAPADLPPDDLYGRLTHLYDQDQDDVHEVVRDFRRIVDEHTDGVIVGEVWYELPRWLKYYGQDGNGLHLPLNFWFFNQPWDAQALRRSVDALEAALPAFAWPNYFLGNHDQPRLASRIGAEQARVAAMLLLTLRGTPILYYGDELGMENAVIPLEKMQDPYGKRLGLERGRDNCRTPMQWDASPYAGFSSVEPWLPVSPDYATCNVAVQHAQPTSMLALYRKLLYYRRTTPALHCGSYRAVDANHDDCYVYVREYVYEMGRERRLVALNLAGEERRLSISGMDRGRVVLSTHLDREETVSLSALRLRPHEGVIIE